MFVTKPLNKFMLKVENNFIPLFLRPVNNSKYTRKLRIRRVN